MKASALFLFSTLAFTADDDWARWRGPNDDGMARGDVPLEWSDTRNVAWKGSIPGRGHSSPGRLGNKLFITTAVPVRDAAAPPSSGGRGAGGGAGLGKEY